MNAKIIVQSLADLFFPRTCSGCTTKLNQQDDFICDSCLNSLNILTAEIRIAEYNGRYRNHGPIDEILPLLGLEKKSIEAEIIHGIKYKNKQKLAVYLGRMHALELRLLFDYSFLTPVPLHKLKQLERGYNQSERIAEGISAVSSLPILPVLKKIVYTETQTHKSASERRKNIKDTFQIQPGVVIEGKNILLVDDVLTTGSTVSECASILKAAGANKVGVATLALTL